MTRPRFDADDGTPGIIGCFYSVYRGLGYGLGERVYAAALAHELSDAGLHVRREVAFDVRFRGRLLGELRVDLLVNEAVVVELKAGPTLDRTALRQLRTYLRWSGVPVGLLLHFGPEPLVRRLEYKPPPVTAPV